MLGPALPSTTQRRSDELLHYTAEPNDATLVKEDSVLKIDIGVHIDGYIADTAVTVCYNPKYETLVVPAETALAEAVRIARANTKAGDIGRVIETAIRNFGFKPIHNLSGHSLQQYMIHTGKSIPNIGREDLHLRFCLMKRMPLSHLSLLKTVKGWSTKARRKTSLA